jgi:alpha/beta superfamily hydrolase
VVEKKPGLRQRWNAIQTSKTAIFWIMIAVIVLTMIVGFSWGGWVTGGTAQKMSTTAAQAAVVTRLAPICAAQFNLDPQKDTKLAELQGMSSYQRSAFVKAQGWATMPGEAAPDNKVADACAKLLVE